MRAVVIQYPTWKSTSAASYRSSTTMPFKDAVDEEFELAQTVGAEEPLLPQHSHDGFVKPRSMLPPNKRRCNFMVLCALLALVILLPSLGLAGCALNEQRVLLPDKLNQWLGKEPAGQGAFPTKYVQSSRIEPS